MRTITLVLVGVAVTGCSSPTSPVDSRTGFLALRTICDDSGPVQLICVAQAYCSGSYRCPDPRLDNVDVTARTQWTIDNPAVIRHGAQPNWFLAVAPGHTVIRATTDVATTLTNVRVGVLPGVPSPLLTAEVWGRVTEAGPLPAPGIAGAVLELSGPLIGTRTAISGGAPERVAGYDFVLGGTNGYQFFGVPRGTYQLTIRAEGYAPQTQTVAVMPPGSPLVEFRLQR
jgi:hypothetical protein